MYQYIYLLGIYKIIKKNEIRLICFIIENRHLKLATRWKNAMYVQDNNG